MLALVLPHGNEVRAVQEDVCCHQHGVGVQAGGGVVAALLGGFVLELGHAAGFPIAGDAHHGPGQLCVFGNVGLHKEGGLLGVDTEGKQLGYTSQGALAQFLGLVPRHGNGVQVRDEVKRIVVLLELDELFHCSQVVAQVIAVAGGLQAGNDALLGGGFLLCGGLFSCAHAFKDTSTLIAQTDQATSTSLLN